MGLWHRIGVDPLSPDDRRHVEAAQGWCELDAFSEAEAELDQVSPESRGHPEVLEARWQLCAAVGEWDQALELANAITRRAPHRPDGYGFVASSLQGLGRAGEAMSVLLQAVQRFPRDELILYDLACICCRLGQLRDATTWLNMAIAFGGDELKKRALDDPELEAVRGGIGE